MSKNPQHWLSNNKVIFVFAGLIIIIGILKILSLIIDQSVLAVGLVGIILASLFSFWMVSFRSGNILSDLDIYLASMLSFVPTIFLIISAQYSACDLNTISILESLTQVSTFAIVSIVVPTIVAIVRHRMTKYPRKFIPVFIIFTVIWLFLLLVLLIGFDSHCHHDNRDARRIADINQLQLALELYKNTDPENSYPATLDALVPTYVGGVPKDPKTGIAYEYATLTASGVVTNYHLGTVLEHKENKALCTDADFNSAALGWVNGFNGVGNDPNNFCNGKPNGDTNPAIYDVTSER